MEKEYIKMICDLKSAHENGESMCDKMTCLNNDKYSGLKCFFYNRSSGCIMPTIKEPNKIIVLENIAYDVLCEYAKIKQIIEE